MKSKILSTVFLLISSIIYAQSAATSPLLVTLVCDLEKTQNVIGLGLVKYKVVNNSNEPIQIHRPEHWSFIGYLGKFEIYFSQREATTFNVHDITLNAHDSLLIDANLNLFDFLQSYEYASGQTIAVPTEVTFLAVVGSLYADTNYFSQKIKVIITPLDKNDAEAFKFIKSKGFDPYSYTAKGVLTSFGFNRELAEALIAKYPESTFAELASISLAYNRAKEAKTKPELKDQVNQLLDKPLKSKYTFVQYLAEELKKKQ